MYATVNKHAQIDRIALSIAISFFNIYFIFIIIDHLDIEGMM